MKFSNLYDSYQNRINVKLFRLLNALPFRNSILLKAMKYSTLSGGKRLRACLIYVVGKIFNVNIITLDVIASVIELIHSYSLIHDDLPCIDNDYFRRGKIACHVKYGQNFSLLAGDALQSLAFNILSSYIMPGIKNCVRLKMISELSNAIGSSGMCFGQTLDLEKKTNEVNLLELEKINLYKTAFLIRSSVRLVLLASNFSSKNILFILDRFSISIGLAFQIQDDIFDIKNDIKKIKKKNKKKNTYPLLIGLKNSEKKVEKLYKEAFSILFLLKEKSFNIDTLELFLEFIIKRCE